MGLLIASIGVYGVISFFIARRSREIGIRMALGALPSQVVGAVLRLLELDSGWQAGLVGLARAARALLVGVSATDPVTFIAVPSRAPSPSRSRLRNSRGPCGGHRPKPDPAHGLKPERRSSFRPAWTI